MAKNEEQALKQNDRVSEKQEPQEKLRPEDVASKEELAAVVRKTRETLKDSPTQITRGGDKPFTLDMGKGKVVQSPQQLSKSGVDNSAEMRKDSTTTGDQV